MNVQIPPDELTVRFSRSSGPGGQNVNRRDTRVEIVWDLLGSRALTAAQKARAQMRLGNRIDAHGRVRVSAGTERTQLANRRAAMERLQALIGRALRPPPPPRRATKPSRRARERRLSDKKRRGEVKRLRSSTDG